MSSDSQVENLDAVADEIIESFDLAMESEGIDAETREKICDVVGDSIGNHADQLLPYIKEEAVDGS